MDLNQQKSENAGPDAESDEDSMLAESIAEQKLINELNSRGAANLAKQNDSLPDSGSDMDMSGDEGAGVPHPPRKKAKKVKKKEYNPVLNKMQRVIDFARPTAFKDDLIVYHNKKGILQLGFATKIEQHNSLTRLDHRLSGRTVQVEAIPSCTQLYRCAEETLVVDTLVTMGETVQRFKNLYPPGHERERLCMQGHNQMIGQVTAVKTVGDVLLVPNKQIVAKNVNLNIMDSRSPNFEFSDFNMPNNYLLYQDWVGDAKDIVLELTMIYGGKHRLVVKEGYKRAHVHRIDPQDDRKCFVPGETVGVDNLDMLDKRRCKWESPIPVTLLKRRKKGIREFVYCVIEKIETYSLTVEWISSPVSADPTPPPTTLTKSCLPNIIRFSFLAHSRNVPLERNYFEPNEQTKLVTRAQYYQDLSEEFKDKFDKLIKTSDSVPAQSSARSVNTPTPESESDGEDSDSNKGNSSCPQPKTARLEDNKDTADAHMQTASDEEKGGSKTVKETNKEAEAEGDADSELSSSDEEEEKPKASSGKGWQMVDPVVVRNGKGRKYPLKRRRRPFPSTPKPVIDLSRPVEELLGKKFVGEVLRIRTLADIIWMDGSCSTNVPSNELIACDADLDQQDHLPGCLVIQKYNSTQRDDPEKVFGLILATDPQDRSCKVKWFRRKKSQGPAFEAGTEECTLFDLLPHPIYKRMFIDSFGLILEKPGPNLTLANLAFSVIANLDNGKQLVRYLDGTTSEVWPWDMIGLDLGEDHTDSDSDVQSEAAADDAPPTSEAECDHQKEESYQLLPKFGGGCFAIDIDFASMDTPTQRAFVLALPLPTKQEEFRIALIGLDHAICRLDLEEGDENEQNPIREELVDRLFGVLTHMYSHSAKETEYHFQELLDGAVFRVQDSIVNLARNDPQVVHENAGLKLCLDGAMKGAMLMSEADFIEICRIQLVKHFMNMDIGILANMMTVNISLVNSDGSPRLLSQFDRHTRIAYSHYYELQAPDPTKTLQERVRAALNVKSNIPEELMITWHTNFLYYTIFVVEADIIKTIGDIYRALKVAIEISNNSDGHLPVSECLDILRRFWRNRIRIDPNTYDVYVNEEMLEYAEAKPVPAAQIVSIGDLLSSITRDGIELKDPLYSRSDVKVYDYTERLHQLLLKHKKVLKINKEEPVEKQEVEEDSRTEKEVQIAKWKAYLKKDDDDDDDGPSLKWPDYDDNGLPKLPLRDATCGQLDECRNHCFVDTKSNPKPNFNRVVYKEQKLLMKELPPGIHVRFFSDRLDLMSALIIGPEGTPFEATPFLFDIKLPDEYPNVPPEVRYVSFSQDQLNPNLYINGKVCTSLLGTWSGEGSENWDPKKSNILQLLLSIQGLILVPEPYYNEAGYESRRGLPEMNEHSERYNETASVNSLEYMMEIYANPAYSFESLIEEHVEAMWPRLRDRLKNLISGVSPPYPIVGSKGYTLALEKMIKRMNNLIQYKKERALEIPKTSPPLNVIVVKETPSTPDDEEIRTDAMSDELGVPGHHMAKDLGELEKRFVFDETKDEIVMIYKVM